MPYLLLVLLVFAALAGGLHYLFVFRHPQTARFWHASDYAWLAVAFLAVLPAVAEIDRLRANADLVSARAEAGIALSVLRRYTDPESTCRSYVRSEYSPPDFDETVAAQADVCRWAESVRARLPAESSEVPARFTLPEAPPNLTSITVRQVEGVHDAFNRYSKAINAWGTAERRLSRRDWEISFLLLSPFLFAGAVALRVTRVSAHALGRIREAGSGVAETRYTGIDSESEPHLGGPSSAKRTIGA